MEKYVAVLKNAQLNGKSGVERGDVFLGVYQGDADEIVQSLAKDLFIKSGILGGTIQLIPISGNNQASTTFSEKAALGDNGLPTTEEYWRVPLARLALSRRTYNALMSCGVNTVGKLMGLRPDEFSRIPNIGEGALQEVEARLWEVCCKKYLDSDSSTGNTTKGESAEMSALDEILSNFFNLGDEKRAVPESRLKVSDLIVALINHQKMHGNTYVSVRHTSQHEFAPDDDLMDITSGYDPETNLYVLFVKN